jgi:hypothetical protein
LAGEITINMDNPYGKSYTAIFARQARKYNRNRLGVKRVRTGSMTLHNRQAILQRLLVLVQQLYAETEGLAESEADLQLWYNRGYANGMLKALQAQGYEAQMAGLVAADPEDYQVGQEFLPWGKAYWHGFGMGENECREALSGEYKP